MGHHCFFAQHDNNKAKIQRPLQLFLTAKLCHLLKVQAKLNDLITQGCRQIFPDINDVMSKQCLKIRQ